MPETENMKTEAIEFNADALVGSVEAFVQYLTGILPKNSVVGSMRAS